MRFTAKDSKKTSKGKAKCHCAWKAPPSRYSWGKHRSLYANEDGKEQGSDCLKIGLVRLNALSKTQ